MVIEELGWEERSYVYRIRECPACGEEIEKEVAPHIWANHDPEDFGLSPIGERKSSGVGDGGDRRGSAT